MNGIFLMKHSSSDIFSLQLASQRTVTTPLHLIHSLFLNLSSFYFSMEKYEKLEYYSFTLMKFGCKSHALYIAPTL